MGEELPTFRSTMHHITVRAKLDHMVEAGDIDEETANEAYDSWLANR